MHHLKARCYTKPMPTKLPRTHITHTPEVEHALDVARARWPEADRESTLLIRLLTAGANAIEAQQREATTQHVARIRALAGIHSDLYEPGYLEELRDGWNE